MKKIYVFMLMLLLIGQTILGPMGTVMAQDIESSSFSLKEGTLIVADESRSIKEGDTVTLNYEWSLSGPLTEGISRSIDLPEQLQASKVQEGQLFIEGKEIGRYIAEGNTLIVSVNPYKAELKEDDNNGTGESTDETADGNEENTESDTDGSPNDLEADEQDTDNDENANSDTESDDSETASNTLRGTKTVAQATETKRKFQPVSETISIETIVIGSEKEEITFGGNTYIANGEDGEEADAEGKKSTLNEIETGKMPESVIKNTEFTIDGKTVSSPVTVQNGQTAEFRFNLELEAGHYYGPGSTMTYTLPDIFTDIKFPEGTQFGDLGEITKSGNDITITFNKNIIDEFGAGTAFEPGAHFFIAATFNNTGNDVNETINLPGQLNIVLNFTPLGGSTISKNNGSPQPTDQNSDYITWTVKVNTDLAASGTVPFVDTLTGGHTFDLSSVKITELTLKPDGTVLDRDVTDYTPSFNGTNTKMTIDLDGTKAYEITYHTLPDDPGNNESVTYRNGAKYGDASVPTREATVNYGTPLNKMGSLNSAKLETVWTIEYNYNKRTISQDKAKLTDTWTIGGNGSSTADTDVKHEIVYTGADPKAGFTVMDSGGNSVSDYTVSLDGDNGFTLAFGHQVTDAYTITYKTKPSADTFITDTMTIQNNVDRADKITSKNNPTVTYSKNDFMLNKSATGTPNYEAKTMAWTITANQAGYSLAEGTVFTDTFTHQNMTLDEDTLVVTVRGERLVQGTGYTLTNKGKDGFDITLLEGTNGRVVIKYTTGYDIRDVGTNDRKFHNSVTIINSGLPVDPSDSAEHRVAPEQTANGKKDGKYNYATKKFEWEVELNFNLNTLEDAIFEDVLPDTQTVDVESIKVLNGTLNSNGIFQPGSEIPVTNTATEPNKIAFSLGKIKGPYKVTYESYDTDSVFPETTGKIQITNNATLKDGDNTNASWTKTVDVNYTDKLIKKNGSQISGTAGIKWNFEFNFAQSDLNNIVITDTVGKDNDGNPNQLIKEDKFVVKKVEFSGKSDNANYNPGKTETSLIRAEYQPTGEVQEGTYQLFVNIQEGKFDLRLPDGDSAFYIEYETIYMGDNNSTVTNEVEVNYRSTDRNQASNNFSISNFRYGNSGTTVKVPFIVVKTDGETGKPMVDVEFTLYSEFQPGVPLISKKTDTDGVFDLEMKLTEGNYTLKETTVEDYDNPGDIDFVLHRDSVEEIGKYAGKQVVVVENFKTGYGATCTEFKLTINDVDRNLVKNKSVTLTNKVTGKRYVMPTNSEGELILLPAEVNAGEYTVAIDENGTEIILGDITVTYDGECEYNLQPNPSCSNFTITLEDKNNVIRPNVTVTLKHEDGTSPEITMTTDANGEINLLSADTQTGVYKVYEGKQFLETVKITYKDGCLETLVQAPACESFTLTVKDVDGNPQGAGISITIKDKEGTEIEKDLLTDDEGKVSLKLEAGEYDVFEGDAIEPFAEFSTNIECEAEVQPLPVCNDFTVTVKTEEDEKRSDVIVTVKDKIGTEIITIKTDENGQTKVPSKDLPAGKYTIYEGELFIGEITVSYLDGCEAEVKGNPTCTTFTLTIQDVNGFARETGVKITIKNSQGNLVTGPTGSEFTTVTGGIVSLDLLPKGTYTIYENDSVIGSFTVVNTCSAIVKPAPSGGGWIPSTSPEDPDKPTDPETPVYPPTDPGKSDPGTPVDPDKPKPGKPGEEDPNDPNKPGQPGEEDPNDPNKPTDPSTTDPTDPNAPGKDDSVEGQEGNKGNATGKPGSAGGSKGQQSNASGKDTLPQTGEELYLYMTIFGFVLILAGGFMVRRRKINE
ncbi:hypothetical protein SLU01_02330 [Sporosarcina luteola]|uniref:Gram-positive cocci surface proteins LPxTG domain-containing protein n=1 Tax=Sporosarcina luteola TaxID=582850 RepID=A0A511Z3A3_9BACL|nr:collagen binding domain-containing protein [Sporosarcina luteola]GEN81921.1 hypothetical protein SLU01_02330 [Sporosarcina luteola]